MSRRGRRRKQNAPVNTKARRDVGGSNGGKPSHLPQRRGDSEKRVMHTPQSNKGRMQWTGENVSGLERQKVGGGGAGVGGQALLRPDRQRNGVRRVNQRNIPPTKFVIEWHASPTQGKAEGGDEADNRFHLVPGWPLKRHTRRNRYAKNGDGARGPRGRGVRESTEE